MERLKKIFCEVLNLSDTDITDSLEKGQTENWDSFNHLVILNEIESQLHVKLTMQEIEEANTYGKFKKLIMDKGVQ